MVSRTRTDRPSGGKLGKLARDIKLAHSVFALPFAFLAVFMAAGGWPGEGSRWFESSDWMGRAVNGGLRMGLVLISMVFARTYAMLLNRYLDREIDAKNPRTAKRAIPAGEVTAADVKKAGILNGAGLAVVAGMFGVMDGNWWPLAASPLVLAWLGGYPLAKRYTWGCHYMLGVALALSVLAGALAVKPEVLLEWRGVGVWALAGFVSLWVAGFDVIYAMADLEFDRAHGVWSVPARFGKGAGLRISAGTHVGAAVLLVLSLMAGLGGDGLGNGGLGWLYAFGVALTLGMLVYEQRAAARDKFEMAFFTLNGVIALVLGGLGILDVVWG